MQIHDSVSEGYGNWCCRESDKECAFPTDSAGQLNGVDE